MRLGAMSLASVWLWVVTWWWLTRLAPTTTLLLANEDREYTFPWLQSVG